MTLFLQGLRHPSTSSFCLSCHTAQFPISDSFPIPPLNTQVSHGFSSTFLFLFYPLLELTSATSKLSITRGVIETNQELMNHKPLFPAQISLLRFRTYPVGCPEAPSNSKVPTSPTLLHALGLSSNIWAHPPDE